MNASSYVKGPSHLEQDLPSPVEVGYALLQRQLGAQLNYLACLVHREM